ASLMYAAEGAKVVVAEFNEAAGEETVRLVREAGGEATFVKTNVANEASAKGMVDHAVATYGRVDVLYNNAGIMPEADHSVIDTSVDDWDRVMAVNVRGVFLGCQSAPKGIRTNAICPGPVETPLLMDWLVKDEDAKRIRLNRNPTGRFGKPEEIVAMGVSLASAESR